MRDFAEQWYGKPGRYSRADVRTALLQAVAVYGSITAMALRLVPRRSRRTLHHWFMMLNITREDIKEFRRQGVVLRESNGSITDVLIPQWKGTTDGR